MIFGHEWRCAGIGMEMRNGYEGIRALRRRSAGEKEG